MKKNELTHIIRSIVSEEIRRELPNAIAEVFSNFMGQKQEINERTISKPNLARNQEKEEETSLKHSLREMFTGTDVMRPPQQQREPKRFAKDPLLNEILNQTSPFTSQQRTGASFGAAAMIAAAQGGVVMPGEAPTAPMMDTISEEAFTSRMPAMTQMMPHNTPITSIASPVSQAELLRDDHAPLSELPPNVSALDVAQVSGGDDPVTRALTRNYSGFLKKVNKAAELRKGVV